MSHAPKIAALRALSERALSPRARLRIERHLATCDVCRRALASITLYRRTVEDVREAEPPELDWSRMELALAREARALSERTSERASEGTSERAQPARAAGRRIDLRAALPYLAAAAALFLVVWAW
ncbi:MAG: zf-HC2 domain-containing protein, partial [Myxococcota bacterium]|nr:zf-HC2 domain-containing protein [Myxococcota bacterium]